MGRRGRQQRRRLILPGDGREVLTHSAGPFEWHDVTRGNNVEYQIRVAGTTGNEPDELIAFTNEGDEADRLLIVANVALLAMAPELKAVLSAIVNCNGLTAMQGYEDELDSEIQKARELLWMIENAPYAERDSRAA